MGRLADMAYGEVRKDRGSNAKTGALIGGGIGAAGSGYAGHRTFRAMQRTGEKLMLAGKEMHGGKAHAALVGVPAAVGGALYGAGGGIIGAAVPVKKPKTVTASKAARDENSAGVRRLQARTPDGKFASHENDLVMVRSEGRGRGRGTKRSTLQVIHPERKRGNTRFGMAPARGRKIAKADVSKALGPIHAPGSIKSTGRMFEMGFNRLESGGARNPVVRQRAQRGFDRATIDRPKPGGDYEGHIRRMKDKNFRAATRDAAGQQTSPVRHIGRFYDRVGRPGG